MREEVMRLIEEVLAIPEGTINENTMMSNVEEWDSLAHVMIIGTLEERMGISIPLDEAIEIKGMQDLFVKAGI